MAVIGAGPHGLAAAHHLRRAGTDAHVLGTPMSFWQGMPAGMCLRSNWSASNIAEPEGELSLVAYQAETGARFTTPIPLEDFVAYGHWVQRRVAPELDRRHVRLLERTEAGFALELDDGDRMVARRAVVAGGIAPFAWRPPEFDHLPAELASHAAEHRDLGRFAGRRVAVIGGGQSALEGAALLDEGGAEVEVFIRAPRIVWLRGGGVTGRLRRRLRPLYAPTDVGPLWYSRLVASPEALLRLPYAAQERIARRCIRPACSAWARARLAGVRLTLDAVVAGAERRNGGLRLTLGDGSTRDVDHLLLATGYRVDVARYAFLARSLLDRVHRRDGYPVLSRGLESSVPGLHFLGAPAARSFGPTMRFVSGGWYAGRAVAQAVRHGAATAAAVR